MSMRKTFFWRCCWAASVTPRDGAGKEFRTEAVALGAGVASAAKRRWEDWGAAVEKESGGTVKIQGFFRPSSSARRSTITTWAAPTASPTSPISIPAISPAVFPIIGAGELPFLMSDAKGGSMGARCLVSQICREGDEGRQILPRLHPLTLLVSTRGPRRSWCPRTSRA